jgi:hypothetical protein
MQPSLIDLSLCRPGQQGATMSLIKIIVITLAVLLTLLFFVRFLF